MNTHKTIRPLKPSDMLAVKAVIDACGLFPSDMLDEMVAGYFSGEAKDNYWLTYDDGEPVAVAYYVPERMTDGTWSLLLIAVHPERQGSGCGSAIVGYIERVLAMGGGRVLLVETSGLPSFEGTREFYKKVGFDEEARIREFYQTGEDKIVFRKVLNQDGGGGNEHGEIS